MGRDAVLLGLLAAAKESLFSHVMKGLVSFHVVEFEIDDLLRILQKLRNIGMIVVHARLE